MGKENLILSAQILDYFAIVRIGKGTTEIRISLDEIVNKLYLFAK